MFNIDVIKEAITQCPPDEIVILCGHWSINQPKYTNDECMNEAQDWDWYEFEEQIDCTLMVNDYDDLICDPHGIMNE